MNKVLEVCCGSYYDALQAYRGGAKRIELNSALHMGGLTPSLATLIKVKQDTDLKVICMLRNRGAGFCYLEEDREVMFADAKILLEHGADGLAFAFLKEDKTVDKEQSEKMVALIHQYGKEAVFHRAIDVVNDYAQGFVDIIACGVDRILTSGANVKAVEGVNKLKKMQDLYGSQIEILAGCGINEDNVDYVLANTGLKQIHSSCKTKLHDPTTSNYGVNFSFIETNRYDVVDQERVQAILAKMNESK
ncbi:MAG: copper homeostasis protein CutC [Erysipelotrichia bacterium]|nr:copper homeostasis protein CutC [Erysipelotrichia bacterium]